MSVNSNRKFQKLADGIHMKTISNLDAVSVDYIVVQPDAVEHTVYHKETDESLFLLEGELEAKLDGDMYHFKKHDCISIPRGLTHKLTNRSTTDVHLLAICAPPYTGEDLHIADESEGDGRV